MGRPAARKCDVIFAIDIHLVMAVPLPSPVPTPLPFFGNINGNVSSNVEIMGKPAATVDSTAKNKPSHTVPSPAFFVRPPTNKGSVASGSSTVIINGKEAARLGDRAKTCSDPVPLVSVVIGTGTTVFIGG
ncbi:PAAR domain-containing protein [Mastigocoleus sp. MO_188.B34]|uniref:PAAR domain-containing protein n=1 Tax=Mastigocoleus sp. MO_188.B34 TaxID=3036635 RepID=UPI0026227EE0|nr:PAAR domain-containing protein [Mastigocoleus sp. MO_188.B34]MDJ0693226.1 PAAR domain-containing protein [Mastigocoleus sp. MO_188.B34]